MYWSEKVSQVRTALEDKIQSAWKLDGLFPAATNGSGTTPRNVLGLLSSTGSLSERELEITGAADATALIARIHSGTWSAEEVTVAFSKRAVLAHKLVNCLMDVDFEAAVARARELDAYLKETGRLVGPLHGLPVSIKDLTAVEGLRYTMGYVSWADRIAEEDAAVVSTLRQAGAVLYVKTTMPQSGMALETASPLFGRTLNPFNTSLTPGGSSGGEGALIACRGSILGIGTDSGGSIRVPAAFNGLYSIKPTSTRVSYEGNMNNSPGGFGPSSSIGPMAHSLRDVKLVTKALIDGRHWLRDAAVVEKPWADPLLPTDGPEARKRLRIGLVEWDGSVMPHPPIRRAMQLAKERIQAAGHEVVVLQAYKHAYGDSLGRRMFYGKGTDFMQHELDLTGEPPIEAIKAKAGRPAASLAENIQAHREWKAYKNAYLAWWMRTAAQTSDKQPIDALLLPAGASASFPHDHVPRWTYVAIYNMLDYAVVTLPVTTVDKAVDVADADFVPVSDADRENQAMYDPELFDGMPVCLQLVGRPLAEEQLLAAAEAVDEAIHGARGRKGQVNGHADGITEL